MQATLIAQKRSDGHTYVMFDKGPEGKEHPYKGHFLQHLTETGHTFVGTSDGHVRLLTGPLVKP